MEEVFNAVVASRVAGSLLKRLPAAAALVAHDGHVVACNEEAAGLLGWKHAAGARLAAPEAPWFSTLRRDVAAYGRGTAIISRRRNGDRAVVEVRASAADEGVILVLFHDCSGELDARRARAVSERRLRHFLNRLQRSEEQLRHAQKMETVGRLASGIAHDFNNVLTVIQGHVQFLLDDMPHDMSSRDEAVEIGRAVDRATDLTRQLLKFARRQPRQLIRLDLSLLVSDMEKLLRRVLRTNIRFDTLLQPVPRVVADPGQMEQVVLNLVVNARDALADAGRITVAVRSACGEEARAAGACLGRGECVLLEVSDTGAGMSADVQRQALEAFFTTKEEGTGLGLSTVHGIVQQYGGHIVLSSEEGVGSVVRIFLPVHRS